MLAAAHHVRRWSAADIHSGSRRRAAQEGSAAAAARQLHKAGAHNRSLHCIRLDAPKEAEPHSRDGHAAAQPGCRDEGERMSGRAGISGERGVGAQSGAQPGCTDEEAAGIGSVSDRALEETAAGGDWQQDACTEQTRDSGRACTHGESGSACAPADESSMGAAAACSEPPAGASSMRRRAAAHSEQQVAALMSARAAGVTFVTSRVVLRARSGSGWLRQLLLEGGFSALQSLALAPSDAWRDVHEDVLDLRVPCRV